MLFFVVVIVGAVVIDFFTGDSITLLGPSAEIDKPAAFATERSVWIVFPLDFLAASRALYLERHNALPKCPVCFEQTAPDRVNSR